MKKIVNKIPIAQKAPNYIKIYNDLIDLKYPEKKELCHHLLAKSNLSTLDIVEIEKKLSNAESGGNFSFNQQHRSYDRNAISYILQYQKEKKLNNCQLAEYFKVSRNSIAKWKKNIDLEY